MRARRRRVFAVEPLDGRDRANEALARGCVVPGITSTYRRIPEATLAPFSDSQKGHGDMREYRRQVPVLKVASRDSGVEMAVGDGSLATLAGLSQDSLRWEPMGSPEPPGRLSRFLASHKLEQVLERSHHFPPPSPAPASSWESQPGVLQPAGRPESEVGLCPAEGCLEAETHLEAGAEEARVAGDLGPGTWACLPGQGLRYLEHLCLVLEQMARLQQLYLQLWTQRLPGDSLEEESALGALPSPSASPDLGSGVQGRWELLSHAQEAEGAEVTLSPKLGEPGAHPPRLSEPPLEPTPDFSASQECKRDVSHWDKVKVLLNRIRWRTPRHTERPAPPGGSSSRMEPRASPERPRCHIHRRTFMPSVTVKQRAKNVSVC